MNKQSDSKVFQIFAVAKRRFISLAMLSLALVAAGMLAGCETQGSSPTAALKAQDAAASELTTTNSELLQLREGDVVKISFPGSPTFDTTQQIRRDGRITLSLVGDVDVVGMTPLELEARLVDLYASQLSSKQVTVEVVSSSISDLCYRNGAASGKFFPTIPLRPSEP